MDYFEAFGMVGLVIAVFVLTWNVSKLEKKVSRLEASLRPLKMTLEEASLVSEMATLRDQVREILAEMNIEARTPLSKNEDQRQKRGQEFARRVAEAKRKARAHRGSLNR